MGYYSRFFASGLGLLATLFIITAAIGTYLDGSENERNLMLIVIHLIFVIVAYPFLIDSTKDAEHMPIWFYRTIMIEAILNSIFLILSQNAVSTGKGPFYLFAFFELTPIFFLQQNKFKIEPKNYSIIA